MALFGFGKKIHVVEWAKFNIRGNYELVREKKILSAGQAGWNEAERFIENKYPNGVQTTHAHEFATKDGNVIVAYITK